MSSKFTWVTSCGLYKGCTVQLSRQKDGRGCDLHVDSIGCCGITTVFLYLGNILVLHITTPALFSLETFNSSRLVGVGTQGLPAYNNPDDNVFNLETYVHGSLYFLPYVVAPNATNLGLHEGTLYDVLNVPAGPGNATVNATGFNITCGYFTDISISYKPYPPDHSLDAWRTNNISIRTTGKSLVSQTAVVDSQSRQIVPGTVSPEIKKTSSTWLPYAGLVDKHPKNTTSGNLFLDLWGYGYAEMPPSNFPRSIFTDDFLSIADFYLIQKLNLRSTNQSHPPENVTLHELENALSIFAASIFWTLGHIPPTHGGITFDIESQFTSMDELPTPPFLLQGDATVPETLTEIRLDVIAGLVASIALMFLSLPSSLFRRGAKDDEEIAIDGTGILHAIWLYRNHPKLQTFLEQVEHPTNENLRDAGLVQIRLVGE
ncbi:hypothetical protein C8R44DRAFT_917562 [Mycena epipterygia]|nr:hypothetical protein C8R44DRAFT_917562 [Mycena epipterygia]